MKTISSPSHDSPALTGNLNIATDMLLASLAGYTYDSSGQFNRLKD